jgi:YggT family protein
MGEQILKYLIDVVFGLFTYALLLRFVMQAMRAPFRNPLGQAVIALTDWIVKPLRRVLPGYKGLDWASLIATDPVPVPVGARDHGSSSAASR